MKNGEGNASPPACMRAIPNRCDNWVLLGDDDVVDVSLPKAGQCLANERRLLCSSGMVLHPQ